MYDTAGTLELSATRGVIAHACALDALLILLVTQRAGFLVLVDVINVLHGNAVKIERVDLVALCQVLVEVFVLSGATHLVGQGHHRRAVRKLLNLGVVKLHVHFNGAVLVLRHALGHILLFFKRLLAVALLNGELRCHI